MLWWAWLVIAAVLLGAEMFVIDAQFYLVFLGIAAGVVGLIGLFGLELSDAAQWLAFALLSVAAMLGFRKRIYEKIRKPAAGKIDEPLRVGDRVTLSALLEPGQSCRVEYRGSTWTARNIDPSALSGEAEIAEIDGLTLNVRQPRSR